MSLSKPALTNLDFLDGHLKIKIASDLDTPQKVREKMTKFQANIQQFFKSHIGKTSKLQLEAPIPEVGEEEEDEEQFQWQLLPPMLREKIVHKMPIQSRMKLAATSKTERELVVATKVDCKLFVFDDLDHRTYHLNRYRNLSLHAIYRTGKRYFINFVCDWQHDIAICFCEERRPLQKGFIGTKVYWLAPTGQIKKTIVPDIKPYDLAVKAAAQFFSVLTEDCKRSTISMPGWPSEVFEIPGLRQSYTIGSSYDNVESMHKSFDYFEPYSFDCYMHKTALKYLWPFSFVEMARGGVTKWYKNRDRDQQLCDSMLDKDIRVLVLHDSFVSTEKMREFIINWTEGKIPDKFSWWAVSTHNKFSESDLLKGFEFEFVEEKYGPKYSKRHNKKEKAPKSRGEVKMSKYLVGSDSIIRATLIIRDNMVMFANYGSAPQFDTNGVITYKTRAGVSEIQF